MIEPVTYFAYVPRGAGVLCALFYYVAGNNLFGWYTGSAEGEYPQIFFMLENFYSTQQTYFYRSLEDDVYGKWVRQTDEGTIPANPVGLVPDAACHELERLQSLFTGEWLFYADDAAEADEFAAYREQGLPVQAINIRHRKLNKLDQRDLIWTYAAPAVDMNVISYLQRHWPLDHNTR
jgi:hypothetical protein